jgi:hypothetical protein
MKPFDNLFGSAATTIGTAVATTAVASVGARYRRRVAKRKAGAGEAGTIGAAASASNGTAIVSFADRVSFADTTAAMATPPLEVRAEQHDMAGGTHFRISISNPGVGELKQFGWSLRDLRDVQISPPSGRTDLGSGDQRSIDRGRDSSPVQVCMTWQEGELEMSRLVPITWSA